ncbi:MAG: GNAT family N-acetyltransferase [Clostridia bacterium]|nr:GNAT family N-acetyltransferase [Clostridia bacterium]
MKGVYKECPRFENDEYLIRCVSLDDSSDLLKVYSDKKAVALFNSDNCGGDTFYYTTEEKMKEVIGYWQWEYAREGFVRWSIIDKDNSEAIGTIEIFNRKAEDYFNNCGLVRLDLRSDYENTDRIINILSLIIDLIYKIFGCDKIATKAVEKARERIEALKKLGFMLSDKNLIGHNGEIFSDYYVMIKE